MIRKILLGLLLCCSAASYADNLKQLTVASPNGKQVISFWQKAKADGTRQLLYNVNYDGKTVLKETQAGLQLDRKYI